MTRKLSSQLLSPELEFSASRSSGPGGQNVNKVNSRITLKFDIHGSVILTPEEKELLAQKLRTRLTNEGVLILAAQDKRSQLQNKEAVITRFDELLARAQEKKKARKATKPSKGAVQNRIQKKKQHAEKKKWRQRPGD